MYILVTEQAAFSLINHILTALNNTLIVGGIFCDLQKAFDCVDHKILLDKLKFYGIEGKLKSLIESYLTNKYQKVTLGKCDSNNNSSEWVKIKCGVLQGSMLGPLLFLICINDLPTLTNKDSNIVLYVNDTSIVLTDTNRDDFNLHANLLFTDINNWFLNNSLNLNLNKTHYLEFNPMKQYRVSMQIQYNDKYLSRVSETKFLGLIIDDTLSWNEHIDKLIKRMASSS